MASPSSVTIFGVEMKLNESIYIEIFNNPDKIYAPGQSVEGRMIVHTRMPDEVKEIIIELEGKGEVGWKKGRRRYSAAEQYVYYRRRLFGDGEIPGPLAAGTRVYSFKIELPNDIPASFNTGTGEGEVTYTLKGEIRRSFFRMNDSASVPLTVTGFLDLNLVEGANLPQECMKTTGTNYLCCREGNITLNLKLLTKSAFVPGEVIDFQAGIVNRSNTRVTGSEAYLKRVLRLYSDCDSKAMGEVEDEGIGGPEVEVADHVNWTGSLGIPNRTDVQPTGLGGSCHVIDVQYFFCVEVHIDGFSSSLTGKLPIVIGTIPLRSTSDDCHPLASSNNPSTGSPGNLK